MTAAPKRDRRQKAPAHYADNWLLGFYYNEVSPRLNRQSIWPQLQERGGRLQGHPCASCGRKDTFTYSDSQTLHCAHQNSCGRKEGILERLAGCEMPAGDQLLAAVQEAAKLAGVIMPSREATPQEQEQARIWGERRDILEETIRWGQGILWSDAGAAAREYLHGRGFEDADIRELELGLFGWVTDLQDHIRAKSLDMQVAKDAGLVRRNFEGYIIFPWRDEHGNALTLYGRWPGDLPLCGEHPGRWKMDDQEPIPKTYALPGERTKADPLYLDRAKKARCRELVLVEGVIDAAIAQVRGDARVCAYVAGTLAQKQVETIGKLDPFSVVLCPDPDAGGDRGVVSALERLQEQGVRVYVAPRLPGDMDPDEFILDSGIEAWRAFLDEATPAPVFMAQAALGDVTPDSPRKVRDEVLVRVLELLEGIEGEGAAVDRQAVVDLAVKRLGFTKSEISSELSKRKKSRPEKRRSQEPSKPREVWQTRLLWTETKEGSYLNKNLANALTMLAHHPDWQGVLAWDEFSQRVCAVKTPPAHGKVFAPEKFPHPWGDHDDTLATAWMQKQDPPLEVSDAIVAKAVPAVAKIQKIHPVRDYLEGLEWDQQPRLDQWLEHYIGAVPLCGEAAYLEAVGAKWMIGAVARIFRPGCKMDTVLVFEGDQGLRKSTAFRILGGEWFTDELADVGSKDAAVQLQGAWIIELAELDALSKSENSRIKSFFTRTVERYVPKYVRHVVEVPRQCVFAGTVNPDTYLKDETGNRRWWPVRAKAIDIKALLRDRDQLWAEAVHRYKSGEVWWLNREQERLAVAEQDARYRADAWEDLVAGYLEFRDATNIPTLLDKAIGMGKSEWRQPEQNRVARCLKRLGWERKRMRISEEQIQLWELQGVHAGNRWIYVPPEREPGMEG